MSAAEEHHEYPEDRRSVASQHSDETLQGQEYEEARQDRPRVRFRSRQNNGDDADTLANKRVESRDHARPPFRSPPEAEDRQHQERRPSEDVAEAGRLQRVGADLEKQQKQTNPGKRTDRGTDENDEDKESGKTRRGFGLGAKIKKLWDIEKARALATKLGREPHHGDGLTSSIQEKTWAGDGNAPVSDLTDDHRKTEEDRQRDQAHSTSEAHRLVREMTQHHTEQRTRPRPRHGSEAGQPTPSGGESEEAMTRMSGGGVLGNLLKLYGQQQQQGQDSRTGSTSTDADSDISRSPGWATPTSGVSTPKREKVKWYNKDKNKSTSSLIGAASHLTAAGAANHSNRMMSAASKRRKQGGKPRLEDEIRVTVHIAEIIARHRFLMGLCRALMKFGAPTHRLEEYMQMTARVLEVDAQFLYLPGCMIVAFDDSTTRTTEFKLVRVAQGVDLSRLADTHSVYKNVVHDMIGVEEATKQLEEIMNRKPRFPTWFLVFMYGLASATVGPFAFQARPIDMPISFLLGCMLGFMQLVMAQKSALYSNVFEVCATVLTSFFARAFGSIRWGIIDGKQQYLFCFSGIAQSAIALILPGFLVLCSSLELQSHQMIAGSIRMVYAIIYSLFLGYGITVGVTIYGLMDVNANSNTSCPPWPISNPYIQRFPFVVAMTIWIVVINQGKFKQAPVMMVIAFVGYVVNYFSTKRIGSNSEVANTLGAFVIGILGNLYSRLWHGHAATAILPAIFVLVPSGLAASGSLISGIASADQIRSNVSTPKNQTSTGGGGEPGVVSATSNTSVFNLGFGMVQVAIGITVGLFMAALVVYPFGKRRSGLFSF
uniref:Pheromone-regulated membrane protein 10 n=1 Tax=Talaromyces marneffei PM1 TaxID=1077442 RepID=A0A093XHG2_TALMA